MAQVIVVGGGLAGLSAAHTLLECGANVLDKQPFMGGNSTKATSGINGASTWTQQELGIPDSAKTLFEDTKKSAPGMVITYAQPFTSHHAHVCAAAVSISALRIQRRSGVEA